MFFCDFYCTSENSTFDSLVAVSLQTRCSLNAEKCNFQRFFSSYNTIFFYDESELLVTIVCLTLVYIGKELLDLKTK